MKSKQNLGHELKPRVPGTKDSDTDNGAYNFSLILRVPRNVWLLDQVKENSPSGSIR
jgi:hypothetical protein